MNRLGIAGCLVIGGALLCGAGCDSRPAKQTSVVPPKAAAEDSSKKDKEALDELLSKEGRAPGRPGAVLAPDGTLPSGHPPIGGAQPAASNGLPKGHPPIPAGGGNAPMAMPNTAPQAVLNYDTPATWVSQPVTSSLRKAQFDLPKVEGDSADGQLIVYYFGPNEGGGVQANLDRWKSMFVTPGGQPVPEADTVVEKFDANGLKVTLLDIAGRYADTTMGQTGGPTTDEYRMFAAVVETANGPWFFKAVGPAATMASHREELVGLLKSAKP